MSLPHLIFYGGKGGVGKTTCAAARAVGEAAAGRRVLVVSTDPAHSLGDALAVRLSSRPSEVRGGGANTRTRLPTRPARGTLRAVELDGPRAFARWLGEHRGPLGDILEHGTWLDRADVEALLDLSIPGVDELVGLLEITRLSGSGSPDLVIVDTAPTGHTLRLLAAPEAVGAVANVLEGLQEHHRVIRQQLARVGRPEAADRLIALLGHQAREMADRLRDPQQTAFEWVTLPEELAVAETEDALATLERAGLHVDEVIVNRILPAGAPCPICDRRRAREGQVIAAIRRRVGRGRELRFVPAEIREPRGVPALARLGRALTGAHSSFDPSTGSPLSVARGDPALVEGSGLSRAPSRAGALARSNHERTASAETFPAFKDAKLLFFGGKGGVGKTTVATATAIRLARGRSDARVLLLSTDPAHSLSDVLGAAVTDAATSVRGAPSNLMIREVDAPRALAARRADLESALSEIAGAFGAGIDSGRSAELMDLAPPGVDELFGVLSVLDARDQFQVIVVDTAPTGHALRLLEMPEAAREWVQVLLRVLLKYRSLVRPGQLGSELVKLSQSIRELQDMLHDKKRTRFIVVTRAAEVPRAETERLLMGLRRLKLATPAIVVNALTLAPGRCAWCRATAAAERVQVNALRRMCGRRSRACVIIQAPLSAPPPRGVRAVEQWAQRWMGEDG